MELRIIHNIDLAKALNEIKSLILLSNKTKCLSVLLSIVVFCGFILARVGRGLAPAAGTAPHSAKTCRLLHIGIPFHISPYGNLTLRCVAGASPRPTVGDEIPLLLSKADKHIKLFGFIR